MFDLSDHNLVISAKIFSWFFPCMNESAEQIIKNLLRILIHKLTYRNIILITIFTVFRLSSTPSVRWIEVYRNIAFIVYLQRLQKHTVIILFVIVIHDHNQKEWAEFYQLFELIFRLHNLSTLISSILFKMLKTLLKNV